MASPMHIWRALLSPANAPLREAAAQSDPTDVRALARLRKKWDKPLVDAALTLARARHKAADKFGDRAAGLVAEPEAIEQATSLPMAHYKAKRFAQAAGTRVVVDLTCGIGGDAMGFVETGLHVLAIDRDPRRAWMARHNAQCPAAASDIVDLELAGRLCHLDPSRRSEAGRSHRVDQGHPGPPIIERVEQQSAGLALKLSPAVDPAEIPWRGQLEFISDRGRLVQAMLWTKALNRHEPDAPRRATRLMAEPHQPFPQRTTHTLAGHPAAPPLAPMGRYLFTVDPALERARLIGALCETHHLAAVHPSLGLLTADHPIASPWLVGFELIAHMPWRLKAVQHWLRAHDGGLIEVKTRGRAIDPDRVQKQLRGPGQTPYTVFILRWDRTRLALITRRLRRDASNG